MEIILPGDEEYNWLSLTIWSTDLEIAVDLFFLKRYAPAGWIAS